MIDDRASIPRNAVGIWGLASSETERFINFSSPRPASQVVDGAKVTAGEGDKIE